MPFYTFLHFYQYYYLFSWNYNLFFVHFAIIGFSQNLFLFIFRLSYAQKQNLFSTFFILRISILKSKNDILLSAKCHFFLSLIFYVLKIFLQNPELQVLFQAEQFYLRILPLSVLIVPLLLQFLLPECPVGLS